MNSSPPGSSVYEYSLGENTGVGCIALLQGIFQTQGSNPGIPHCRWILYWLSHHGNPRILEWVAYPFSRGSSWPRNQTEVSCIAGGFFTSWATREAHKRSSPYTVYQFQRVKCTFLMERSGVTSLTHDSRLASPRGEQRDIYVLPGMMHVKYMTSPWRILAKCFTSI